MVEIEILTNDHKVATVSKLHLTLPVNIMQSFKSIRQF